MSNTKVAFLGLGVMGYPMAGHLSNAGYQTRVYNRTAAKAEKWCQEYAGDFALTPREAAEGADFGQARGRPAGGGGYPANDHHGFACRTDPGFF